MNLEMCLEFEKVVVFFERQVALDRQNAHNLGIFQVTIMLSIANHQIHQSKLGAKKIPAS